jgi:circadian clock protein KaiB
MYDAVSAFFGWIIAVFLTLTRGEKMAAKYVLKLYVTGETANSQKAIENLKSVLKTELNGLYSLEVIDVLKNPQLAEEDKILATPTLAKVLPPPVRKIIGDLSSIEKVLLGLDLTVEKEQLVDAKQGM